MKHDDRNVNFEFNLPGFDKKDIKVNLTKDKAEIVAEKTKEKKLVNKGFSHHEKSYQSFYYHTNIPEINPYKAKTEYKDGVLRISAPRQAKQIKKKIKN